MDLALASDFPSTPNLEVARRILGSATRPRVAWIAPAASSISLRLPIARRQFRAAGIEHLEFVDAGKAIGSRATALTEFDAVYLTGGNPITYRGRLIESGVATAIKDFAASGRPVIGASGGAMQLTLNVSIYRLQLMSAEDVLTSRADFVGLGLVSCELLPHLNRHEASFIEQVRQYSEAIPHDVVALDDGAALLVDDKPGYRCCGRGLRFSRGQVHRIDDSAIGW